MIVRELIDLLSEYDADSQVLIQFLNGDRDGSAWQDTEYLDEDDVVGKGNTVVIDISNK